VGLSVLAGAIASANSMGVQMQSDKLGSLLPALLKAQSEMGAVKKKATNPFFKSKYADLASVQEAVEEPLRKNGLVIVQGCGLSHYGNFVYTTLYHESGEWIRSEVPMILAKQDPQGVGSAVTYFRRYGIVSMLNLEQEDDDGNLASYQASINETALANGQKPNANSTQKAGIKRATEIKELLEGGFITGEMVKEALKISKAGSVKDLPTNVAQELINFGLDSKSQSEG